MLSQACSGHTYWGDRASPVLSPLCQHRECSNDHTSPVVKKVTIAKFLSEWIPTTPVRLLGYEVGVYFYFYFYWDRILLCILGYLWIHHVAHTGLELTTIFLSPLGSLVGCLFLTDEKTEKYQFQLEGTPRGIGSNLHLAPTLCFYLDVWALFI